MRYAYNLRNAKLKKPKSINPKIRQSQAGFTLIEILIALSIAAVTIVAIVDAMAKGTAIASELEQRVIASWVASNAIAEFRYNSKIDRIREKSYNDTVKMGGHRWRVKSRVKKTDVEKVYLLTVEVRDNARGREAPLASMTTAVADPL